MKLNTLIHSSIAVLAFVSFSSTAFAAGEIIGVNSAVKGNVSVQTAGQSAIQAALREPIRIGDEINSSHLSSLQVLLKDQTIFTVGADCLLTIDKFVYDPATNQNQLAANVTKGMFRFMSGNISKSGANAVTIDTPVASMGVRGTMVQGLVGADAIRYARQQNLIPPGTVVDPNGASLFILVGPGPGRSGKNKKGEISVTSGGETIRVRRAGSVVFVPDSNSSPIDGGIASEALLDIFSSRLSTKPRGGASVNPFVLDAFMEKEIEETEFQDPEFFNPIIELDYPTCRVEFFNDGGGEPPRGGDGDIPITGGFGGEFDEEFGQDFDFHCEEDEGFIETPLTDG
ncbi:MAG: FecR domain-containing protein [Robiginitomaculum sp.]|nr:FecR domain-containing protein [Robiginitomaculum sp.]